MSDDRELVERLAAIDATPRASWVAELRADLDAAWETGDASYLDSLRTTTLTLVDHEPTPSEPSSGRRRPILIASAAAIVVAIALVAIRNDDAAPADQPSPTVTVVPTLPPRALPDSIPAGARLLPGTYFVDDVDGTATPRIYFTIGAGWTDMVSDQVMDWYGLPSFSHPGAVFSDACQWEDGYHPAPLTTVDALVAALREQGGWAEVTAPSDISIDGYSGKAFQRTVATDISECDTMRYGPRNVPQEDRGRLLPAFRSWQLEEGGVTPKTDGNSAGFGYEAGMVETLWVLDIDGTVVVINTRPVPEASAADRAEFAAVLDSIRIDQTDQPSPTVTMAPTQPPRALSDSGEGLLPGTYFVDEVEGTPTPRIFFTIGAGYRSDGEGVTDNLFNFGFSRPGAVFSDACHWEDEYHPGPLTTVDALVAALREQGGWADVTVPSDISIDGYAGKAFQRTAPVDMSDCDPHFFGGQLQPLFASWQLEEGDWTPASGNLATFGYGPGQIETLLVLDIDGTIVVINSRPILYSLGETEPDLALTSGVVSAEYAAVLDSIRIERP